MNRVDSSLAAVSRVLSIACVLGVVGIVTYSVFMRYVLGNAPAHADEISTFLVAGIVFIGATPTFVTQGHVRVTLLDNFVSERGRQRFRLLTLLVGAGTVLLFTYETWQQLLWLRQTGMTVQMWRETPLWWPYLALPLGLASLSVAFLLETFRQAAQVFGQTRSAIGCATLKGTL